MTMQLLRGLALGLVLTEVIELIFALTMGVRSGRDLLLVGLSNLLTNPLVVLLSYLALYKTALPMGPLVLLLEAGAILLEWRCYLWARLDVPSPLLFSLAANGTSYLLGLGLNYL